MADTTRFALHLSRIVEKLFLMRHPTAFSDAVRLPATRLKLDLLPAVAAWPSALGAIVERAFPPTTNQPFIREGRSAKEGAAWGVAFDVVRDGADDLACEILREEEISTVFHLRGAGVILTFAQGTPGASAWETLRRDAAIREREARVLSVPDASLQVWDDGHRIAFAALADDIPAGFRSKL